MPGARYNDHQFTQEFQALYTGDDRLQGVVGVYYLDGHARRAPSTPSLASQAT